MLKLVNVLGLVAGVVTMFTLGVGIGMAIVAVNMASLNWHLDMDEEEAE